MELTFLLKAVYDFKIGCQHTSSKMLNTKKRFYCPKVQFSWDFYFIPRWKLWAVSLFLSSPFPETQGLFLIRTTWFEARIQRILEYISPHHPAKQWQLLAAAVIQTTLSVELEEEGMILFDPQLRHASIIGTASAVLYTRSPTWWREEIDNMYYYKSSTALIPLSHYFFEGEGSRSS